MRNIKIKKTILAMVLVITLFINSVFAETLNTKIEIINYKLSGINIINMDTVGQKMNGTKFKVINKDSTELIGEYITNSEGNINIGNLVQGNYQVAQIQTLEGYELNTNTYDLKVEFDKPNTEVTVINEFLGNIRVVVKDSKTQKLLENAKFNITNISSNEIKEYITNPNGEIFIEKTKTASYEIEQIIAPEFYEKDNQKYTVNVVPENTSVLELENKPYSDIHIYSLDNYDDSPLKNTKFKVINLDTNEKVGEYITDENGIIEIQHLYPATYKVEQLEVDNRYDSYSEIQSTVIEFAKDPTIITFKSEKKGGIHLIKKNIDGELLNGVKFNILREDNTSIGEYETNENGEILVEYLDKGKYKVIETKALDGYYLNPNIYEITVENQKK